MLRNQPGSVALSGEVGISPLSPFAPRPSPSAVSGLSHGGSFPSQARRLWPPDPAGVWASGEFLSRGGTAVSWWLRAGGSGDGQERAGGAEGDTS